MHDCDAVDSRRININLLYIFASLPFVKTIIISL